MPGQPAPVWSYQPLQFGNDFALGRFGAEEVTRHRDGEFEMPERASRAQILQWWESGWSVALAADLKPARRLWAVA